MFDNGNIGAVHLSVQLLFLHANSLKQPPLLSRTGDRVAAGQPERNEIQLAARTREVAARVISVTPS